MNEFVSIHSISSSEHRETLKATCDWSVQPMGALRALSSSSSRERQTTEREGPTGRKTAEPRFVFEAAVQNSLNSCRPVCGHRLLVNVSKVVLHLL